MDGGIRNSYDHCRNNMFHFYRALSLMSPELTSCHTADLGTVNPEGFLSFSSAGRQLRGYLSSWEEKRTVLAMPSPNACGAVHGCGHQPHL